MSDPHAYYRRRREELVPFLPEGCARVLEVGCGEGSFRVHFDAECEYWGIEPVAAAAAVARRTLHEVLVGTYDEVSGRLPEDYFDLVVCNDVIEHMVEPETFLRGVGKHLREEGRLLASVPNVRYCGNLRELLLERDWRYREEGILDATHLRFFTEKSLRRILEATGWEILELRGVNPVSLQAGSRWSRLLRRMGCRAIFALFGRDLEFLQYAVRARRRRESPAPGG